MEDVSWPPVNAVFACSYNHTCSYRKNQKAEADQPRSLGCLVG